MTKIAPSRGLADAISPSKRVVAVDIARGLAVMGVVFNHVVAGLTSSGLHVAGPVADINSVLYLFRMTSLVFLIGLFIPNGVDHSGANAYLRRRLSLLTYLYLLWFVILTGVDVAASNVKNHHRDALTFLRPWETWNQLWFLPMLLMATVVVVLAAPWASRWRACGALVGASTLAIATWGWNVNVVGLCGLSLILFAVAGATVGLTRVSRLLEQSLVWWMAAVAVSLPALLMLWSRGAVPPSVGRNNPSFAIVLDSIAAAISGLVLVLALSALLARVPLVRVGLSFVGRHTLQIFLAHVIASAGLRVILTAAGLADSRVILAATTISGVIGPLAFGWWASRRRWLSWLFEIPRVRRLDSIGLRAKAASTAVMVGSGAG